MSLLSPLRVAVIGFGRMGMLHASSWRNCRQADLVAILDPDEEARRRATDFETPVFARLDEMLEEARPEAVCVCAPPSSHAELITACLQRGVHVLCEKPLTTDPPSARRVWRLAGETGLKMLVATKFRHIEEIETARHMVRSGAIGELLGFRIEFSAFVPMANRWYSVRSVSGGGVIIDNGSHAFDLVSFLFADIHAVAARLGEAPQGLEVEETASIEVTTAEGVAGTIELSWSKPSGRDDYLAIYGERGSLHIGWQRSRFERPGRDPVWFGQTYDKVRVHNRMMERFCRVIQGVEPPWIEASESLLVAEAIEAAYRSCRSQTWEQVGELAYRATCA